MALPSSGPISMSEIRAELLNDGKTSDLRLSFLGSLSGSGANRTSGYTPINQSSLSKPSSLFPASVGEWYSYDHNTNKACSNGYNLILGPQYSYVRYEVTGDIGASSTVTMYLPVNDDGNYIQCRIYTGSYPFTNLGTLSLTLTPNFSGEFTSAGYQYYNFDLFSTSTIVHIVAWDETIPSGNYNFFVNAGCGTTTTTTTLAPVTFTATPTCNGSTVDILVDNFAGGTGTYSWIASGSFESEAFFNISGAPTSVRYAIVGSSYTFTGLPQSSTVYIVVKDSGGNNSAPVIVNTPTCATTTTTTTAAPTTTTTTTTAAPTTTTTTTVAPVDFTATPSCVSGTGEILANNYTGGTGTYEWIAIGTSESSAATNVNNPATRFAAGTSYNFTGLSDGNYFIALKDNAGNSKVTAFPGINISCATTTTTTTTTSTTTSTTTVAPTTTTTTTTLAPVQFTATPSCVSGTGEILANNYTGGTGTYEWIAIGTSEASANSNVNNPALRFSAGTSYNFTSLADGTYYIALRDSGGNGATTAFPGINISCATTTTTTTTTTTSTTTTTTTATPVYLYCTGYSSASDCCVAIDDYAFECGGGGGLE